VIQDTARPRPCLAGTPIEPSGECHRPTTWGASTSPAPTISPGCPGRKVQARPPARPGRARSAPPGPPRRSPTRARSRTRPAAGYLPRAFRPRSGRGHRAPGSSLS